MGTIQQLTRSYGETWQVAAFFTAHCGPRRSKPLYIAVEYMKLDSPNALPAHIEDAVSDIAKVHLEHRRSAGRLQRLVDAITAMLGRPVSIAIIAFLIAGWIIFNCFAESVGFRALDPPPFQFLSVAVSMTALFMAAMILTTQRRETELADRREQLTLELAILSDRRTAKLIQLVENIRRDHPELSDAVDEEALAMSSHTNVQDVLNALKKSHDPNFQQTPETAHASRMRFGSPGGRTGLTKILPGAL